MKTSEIRLGEGVFDRRSGRLSGPNGSDVELRNQSIQVLSKLAETPGETVSRKTFFETVWEGSHVGEDSLVQCIAEIRQAIGDKEKRIIETIPRKGYRLTPTAVAPSRRARWSVVAGALAVLGVVGVAWAAIGVLRSAEEGATRTVAVLAFADHSPDTDRSALGDSISENILTDLARYPELTVIARNSSFRFRGGTTPIEEIGDALGAGLLLEGSQQLDGRNLRVTARLVEAETGTQIWADRIETEVEHLFDVSTAISARVANAVEGVVADLHAQDASLEAADALLLSLKGRQILADGVSSDNALRAAEANRRAVARYPEEPWGHIGLAFALRMQLRFGWAEDPETAMAAAIHHAETAVRLAPDNYAANYALCRVRMRAGNQIGAIEALDRAIFLNPSAADAMNALAQSYLYTGETERSFEVLARSAEIDPLPSIVHAWMMAWTAWQVGDCEAARDSFAVLPAIPPDARKLQAAILGCLGDQGGAASALATYLEVEPDWTLERERFLYESVWIAEGALERWLSTLSTAGLPEG